MDLTLLNSMTELWRREAHIFQMLISLDSYVKAAWRSLLV